MKAPRRRGTTISRQRIAGWVRDFRFYRQPPDDAVIQQWIDRFSRADRDTAARVLDCVQIVSDQDILLGYRNALRQLDGWSSDPAHRVGRWFFVGFGGSGASGQAMLRAFREANQLNSAVHDHLFCSAAELPSKKLTDEDRVVFVDDFSGSGRQITRDWPTLQELVASDATCCLILTAATHAAISKIRTIAELILIVEIVLEEEDNIFSSQCRYFSKTEKRIIEKYNKRADRKHPKGFGDCGLLFILSHKTPNNTIPVLHASHGKWRGLFPRYLLLPEDG